MRSAVGCPAFPDIKLHDMARHGTCTCCARRITLQYDPCPPLRALGVSFVGAASHHLCKGTALLKSS